MSTEATEQQGGPERRRSQEISLNRQRPPLDLPGYDAERCLGVGAYGEVWVAIERNTGRRVAIKFYTHRGGLDWSLLSREVEKLSFLFSDRYIVQLLSVGWNAEPPYYIMEYIERGSLAEQLRQGPLSVDEAVDIFRGVAIGLVHAHDKGVLHCDLKPANILLDQDGHPRLADFGQSRLSHEQIPSLGTLFYMAPEQARLSEAPDARWDVYALGAVLYCMLTGRPPHRSPELVNKLEQTPDLQRRLNLYCRSIRKAPLPTDHRQIAGVDGDLQTIVESCLAAKPEDRFPNVQAVLSELDARDTRKARRPMMLLGAIGPALLMLVVFAFAWWGFSAALGHSEKALTDRALRTNEFVAQFVARTVGDELEDRYDAAESIAGNADLHTAFEEATGKGSPLRPLLDELSGPALQATDEADKIRDQFRAAPARRKLQDTLHLLAKEMPYTVGWFLNDADGVQVARSPERNESGLYFHTIGKYYGWRSYFHGGPTDEDKTWSAPAGTHIRKTHLSDVFVSQAIDRWVVAVSAPIYSNNDRKTGRFLGTVSLLVEVGG
ncbi:MAG: serine/threonine protein kinase, partial [Planctomycetota bacterium]|nr:serine/threonine protein kinase [Planctomycetota bacterium]